MDRLYRYVKNIGKLENFEDDFTIRDTLANFFGGINIFLDKPFTTGDHIVLESGERGEVPEIGVRSTLIRTRDDEQISISETSICIPFQPNRMIRPIGEHNEDHPSD